MQARGWLHQRSDRNTSAKRKPTLLPYIAATHVAVIVTLYLFGNGLNQKRRPEVAMRVQLVSPQSSRPTPAPPQPIPQNQPPPQSPPAPATSVRRYRTAADIRASVQQRTENAPPKKATPAPRESSTLYNRLAKALDTQPVAVQPPPDRYPAIVRAHIFEQWRQPTRSEVSGNPLYVRVRVSIAADGTVTSATPLNASGNHAMDESVHAMLRTLRRLPAPSAYGMGSLTLDVTLQLAH